MAFSTRVSPLLLAGAIALSGCAQDAPPAEAPAAPATDTTAASGTGTGNAINAPLAVEDIDTRLELVGAPVFLAANDSLRVTVRVHNDGRVALSGEGSAPVNLGAMLLGPNGPDEAPGNRDFQRLAIPVIPAGGSAEITGELPVQPMLGLALRLELVQEGVAWFAGYGEPTLDLGTLDRCAGEAATLCGSDGQPLARE